MHYWDHWWVDGGLDPGYGRIFGVGVADGAPAEAVKSVFFLPKYATGFYNFYFVNFMLFFLELIVDPGE